MDAIKIASYVIITMLLLLVMPSTSILPLPESFVGALTSIFAFMKMIREWPILSVLFEGFNIYLWFLAAKITWNTVILLVSRFTDFELIEKFTI